MAVKSVSALACAPMRHVIVVVAFAALLACLPDSLGLFRSITSNACLPLRLDFPELARCCVLSVDADSPSQGLPKQVLLALLDFTAVVAVAFV
jgi:hypothetical protein